MAPSHGSIHVASRVGLIAAFPQPPQATSMALPFPLMCCRVAQPHLQPPATRTVHPSMSSPITAIFRELSSCNGTLGQYILALLHGGDWHYASGQYRWDFRPILKVYDLAPGWSL